MQAKLDVYFWFGSCSDSAHVLDHLPEGFSPDPSGGTGTGPPKSLLSAGTNSRNSRNSLPPLTINESHLVI